MCCGAALAASAALPLDGGGLGGGDLSRSDKVWGALTLILPTACGSGPLPSPIKGEGKEVR